jgi:hypothetical protein
MQMALNRKVNELVGLVTSRVFTPFHSSFNSSIDGYRYMSTFSFLNVIPYFVSTRLIS